MLAQPTLALQTAVHVKSCLSPKGLDCYVPMQEPNLVSHMLAVTWCKTCTKNQDFVIECPGIKQSDHQAALFGLGQSWLLGRGYSPTMLLPVHT